MTTFCSSRLALARRYNGLTKRDLAEAIGISARRLNSFESETEAVIPSEKTLLLLSEHLGFPVSFFCLDEVEELPSGTVNFRARTKMTRKQRDKALSSGSFAIEYSDWLDKTFNLPSVDVPNLEDASPEEAASSLRYQWGLGEAPINDMISLLEERGVRVFSLYEEAREIDAFSFWDSKRQLPFVFLSTTKSGERSRMDAAHELGHLVMHRYIDVEKTKRDVEKEANAFAACFLMPENDIRGVITGRYSLGDYIQLKKRWKVSVASLVYRLHQLEMISDWVYHSLFRELSSRGMRANEPDGIKSEKSQVLNKVYSLIAEDGKSGRDIARDLSLPYEIVAKLSFMPQFKVIKGGKLKA